MSISILVLSLIATAVLNVKTGQIDAEKIAETNRRMDVIERAIVAFRLTNSRIPCPSSELVDIDTMPTRIGVEAASGGTCKTAAFPANPWPAKSLAGNTIRGSIPVRALNLSNEYLFDAWGRKFSYVVNMQYASAVGSGFGDVNYGGFIFNDLGVSTAIRTGADTTLIDRGVAYALISHGKNGHGAYLRNGTRMTGVSNTLVGNPYEAERQNCKCLVDATDDGAAGAMTEYFYDMNPWPSSTASFDDIVRFKTRWHLFHADEVSPF